MRFVGGIHVLRGTAGHSIGCFETTGVIEQSFTFLFANNFVWDRVDLWQKAPNVELKTAMMLI